MDFHLGSVPAQKAVALGECAVVVMVVAIIVVIGFKGCKETIKKITGADFDGVHECLVGQVHAHHFLADELIDARDLFFQQSFRLLVFEDLLSDVFYFFVALCAVFFVAFARVAQVGEEFTFFCVDLWLRVRAFVCVAGDGRLDIFDLFLALSFCALSSVGDEKLFGEAQVELACEFDFFQINKIGNLAVGEGVAQLFIRGGTVAGELVNSEVFVEVFEVVFLHPTVEHEAHDGFRRTLVVIGEDGEFDGFCVGVGGANDDLADLWIGRPRAGDILEAVFAVVAPVVAKAFVGVLAPALGETVLGHEQFPVWVWQGVVVLFPSDEVKRGSGEDLGEDEVAVNATV